MNDLFSLNGKTALLTGATGHLGHAMARALADAGANVIATSRDVDRASALAATLPQSGDQRHAGVALDQTDAASIELAFAAACSANGCVDILINNAHAAVAKHWRDITTQEFSGQLIQASGYFTLARLFRDHVVERRAPGSIVLIASMYGMVASYPQVYEGIGKPNPVAYQVLKAGLIQMARHLAVYWAKDGVRVNCISPGPFPADGIPAELRQRLEVHSPMGRLGRPEELRGSVVFLASDASSYVTGHNLVVDGGWTAW